MMKLTTLLFIQIQQLDYITVNNQELKEVYDLMGVMVISTFDTKIDVNHLSSGIYYLRIVKQKHKVY